MYALENNDGIGILISLSGGWDIRYLEALEKLLGKILRREWPMFVDLSRITFLDARCARELAVQYQLHRDNLVLCNPSPQVRLTRGTCGIEEWIDFATVETGAG